MSLIDAALSDPRYAPVTFDERFGVLEPNVTVATHEECQALMGNVSVSLTVPEVPTVRDFGEAYLKQIAREAEMAEEAVFNAELDVANAQRIANAQRERAARLRAQEAELRKQLDRL